MCKILLSFFTSRVGHSFWARTPPLHIFRVMTFPAGGPQYLSLTPLFRTDIPRFSPHYPRVAQDWTPPFRKSWIRPWCMHACVHVCMCTCMVVWMNGWMYIYVCTLCMCVCMCVYMYVFCWAPRNMAGLLKNAQ